MQNGQPVLIMIQGPEPGSFYRLPDNRVTTIGRSSRNSIRVVTPSVSRFHCEISSVNGVWELSDLNSRKGTMVNSVRVRDRTELRPGDVIRLSSTVFRFDLMKDDARATEPIIAVREAELGVRLRSMGEATATLDEIKVRSRLDGERLRRDHDAHEEARRRGLGFLCVVFSAVSVLVAGALLYGYMRAGRRAHQREIQAREVWDEAVALAREAREVDALERLNTLQVFFPNSTVARGVDGKKEEVYWAVTQRLLSDAVQSETRGNFAEAFDLYSQIDALEGGEEIEKLVERRREYTERLAHAAFRSIEEQAREERGEGDLAEALALYRNAADRIGIPELAEAARRRAEELGRQTLR